MPRPILATISIDAMRHNLAAVKSHLERAAIPGSPKKAPFIMAIVKANAYGHGVAQAVLGFEKADGLGLINVSEAALCRELGWQKPLFLLEGFFDTSDLPMMYQLQLSTAVHSLAQIEMLEKTPKPEGCLPLPWVMLKFNTGMHRLGFDPKDLESMLARLMALKAAGKIARIGLKTHFASADLKGGITQPFGRFIPLCAHEGVDGISMANSATVLAYPDLIMQQDKPQWVRPGLALYGASPFGLADKEYQAPQFGLKPTMHLKAGIIAVQNVPKGCTVGYGATFTAPENMRIGIVACGYADGYLRHAPTGTPVLVEGQRSRVLGRVSMDMMAVDLTHLPQMGMGDWVVLWGDPQLPIEEVAQHMNTIPYELLCALHTRVPLRIENSLPQGAR